MIPCVYYRVLVQRIAAFLYSTSSQFFSIFCTPCCNASTTPPLGLRQNRDDDKKSHSRKRRWGFCLQREGPRVFVVVFFFPLRKENDNTKASTKGQNGVPRLREEVPRLLFVTPLKQLGRVVSVPQSHERFVFTWEFVTRAGRGRHWPAFSFQLRDFVSRVASAGETGHRDVVRRRTDVCSFCEHESTNRRFYGRVRGER